MVNVPAVPGAINVVSLTGDEIVELHPFGPRRAQTTTQAIADLGGGGGGSLSVTGGATTVTDVTAISLDASMTVTDGGGGTAEIALSGVRFNYELGFGTVQSFAAGDATIISHSAQSESDESGSNLTLRPGSGDGVGSGGNLTLTSGAGGATGDAGDIVFTPGTTGGGGRDGVPILNNIATIDPDVTNAIWSDNGVLTFSGTVTVGAITAVAGAATLDARSGIVTSEGLTGATTYALTLTNSFIKTTSVIQITAMNSAGLVTWPKSVACSNGSAVITVGMAALTGTVVINFSVFN